MPVIPLFPSLLDCGPPVPTFGSLSHTFITSPSPLSPLAWPRYPASTNSYISSWPFVRGLFIALKMEAVCTSETSAYYETTRRYIPEICHLLLNRYAVESTLLALSTQAFY